MEVVPLNRRIVIFALVGAAVFAAALLVLSQMRWRGDRHSSVSGDIASALAAEVDKSAETAGGAGGSADGEAGTEKENADGQEASDEASEEPQSEEEKAAAEEERLVEEFDSMTDKWMEPGGREVSMDDVSEFGRRFRQLPASRKEECLHRALNLLPDENVMLLAGVLFDKSLDKDYLELVYNDILNRDEDVKKPILNEIYKDRSHPCWADTAWILDVTGEKPSGRAD